ncbi:MAG: hypothetical protein VSS75_013055 [Candidatus Parabeggiatoa sp.]|nr:hypothetical protein [Candidatus Parabeggiatoa sp.]
MNTLNEQHTNDPTKVKLYLVRVSDLFSQIKTWFQGELEVATDTIQIKEPAGNYEAPTLSLREKGQAEILANIIPQSAGVILTEGMIEINGGLDQIHLEYMSKGGPQVTLEPGNTRPMFNGVNQNGWYWIVDPVTRTTRFTDKASLLEMITWVSDHDF